MEDILPRNESQHGALEWLFGGDTTAKLLDFFITYQDIDYSETDIAKLAGISIRSVFRELPDLESVGLIKFTRKVGRAKMYRLNINSEEAKYLRQFVFGIATRRVNDTMKADISQEAPGIIT